MRKRGFFQAWTLGVVLGLSGYASADVTTSRQNLLADAPGIGIMQEGKRAVFYGKPMLSGETPEGAVETWLGLYGDALGVDGVELQLMWGNEVGVDGRFTVYAFGQAMDGVPVENHQARILVLNGLEYQVVYAAGHLSQPPVGGFATDALIDGADALAAIAANSAYADIVEFQRPELVVLAPDHDNELVVPLRTWKVTGHGEDLANHRAFSFYVDAAGGGLVHVQSEIYHVDVAGHISGNATPGTLPDVGYNPPVLVDIEGAIARINGTTEFDYSDENGDYNIFHIGTAAVTVVGELEGLWVNVLNDQGAEHVITIPNVTPPGPADILFNASPTEFVTAQVNTFVHTTGVHDFYKDRQPSYGALDLQLTANANLSNNCNAFFTTNPLSINFYTSGGGCPNTAFSSVVYHEYGHFIVNRLNLSQGAFGEGFGDTIGILAFDDPIVGEDFFGPGTSVRDIVADNVQYPCSGQIHFCGQLLAGCWWDIKLALEAVNPQGLEIAQQLMTDWSQITLGGIGDNSAHPGTAIEALTADDDDGDIFNGTPNFFEICAGFAAHSIDCPEIPLIAFEFPNGLPDIVEPGLAFTFPVDVVPSIADPLPGSATLLVSVDGGPFNAGTMVETAPNQYDATLPSVACGANVSYYFSAQAIGGGSETSPIGAPANTHGTVAATGLDIAFEDDMESNQGWTVGDPGDNATTGIWVRVDPVGTAAQPENDHTPTGTMCWVTGQGVPGGPLGANDVDGGRTTLVTPAIDLSFSPGAKISYWRWYSNDTGASPGADTFVIDISDQNGNPGTWVNVEIIGPDGPEATGGWIYHEFLVSDFVTPTGAMKMRFAASDFGSGSIVEAAIDDFRVDTLLCGPLEFLRRGDCNQDGSRNISDAVRFLDGVFGGGAPFVCDDACDANDDGAHSLPDVFAILDAVFSGVPLPDPFLDCGLDPTDDGLDCAEQLGCP